MAKTQEINAGTGAETLRDLTAAELADLAAVQQVAQAAAQAEAARLADMTAARALVLQTAGGAVGIRFDALSNIQVRALAAILLWKEGALDNTGIVKPLNTWVKSS